MPKGINTQVKLVKAVLVLSTRVGSFRHRFAASGVFIPAHFAAFCCAFALIQSCTSFCACSTSREFILEENASRFVAASKFPPFAATLNQNNAWTSPLERLGSRKRV